MVTSTTAPEQHTPSAAAHHPQSARAHRIADKPAYDHREPFARVFMEMERSHPYVRFARAHAASWTESPMPIGATERIVGVGRPARIVDTHFASGIQLRREMCLREMEQHPERREELQAVLDYFPTHATGGRIRAEAARRGVSGDARLGWGASYQGHMVVDYAKMLRLGIAGVRSEVFDAAARASADALPFYQALGTMCDIYTEVARLYAREAVSQATACRSPARRAELTETARVCHTLVEHPPQTFHEALQLYWFTILLDGVDDPGRADQYLIGFYRSDLAEGRTSRGHVRSLLEELWLKLHQHGAWSLVLGGQHPDGSDATNELTYLCLEVTRALRLPTNPAIPLRFHAGSPRKLWQAAMACLAEGSGMPSLANDDAIVPALVAAGVKLEDARDYGMGGCIEYQVCGKSNFGGEDGDVNLAKCLELALNNGRCQQTGEQLGPQTGEPETFTTYEQLFGAYCAQVEHALDWIMEQCRIGHEVKAQQGVKLHRSLLTDDCVARGVDCSAGGARYGNAQILTMGTIVAADSLAAVRSLVYEKQRFSLTEFLAALRANWIGYERLRAIVRRCAPRFGNGEPAADDIARAVSEHAWSYLGSHPTGRGGHFTGLLVYFSRQLAFGRSTGATPDGRADGDVLEDSAGPWPGRDTNGPTAMMRSASRVAQHLAAGGVVLNLKLTPTCLSSHGTREKMIDLIRSYFAMGGQYVQVTVASPQDLEAAMREPDKWRHLLVRVGGYCARFTDLHPDLQASIARRVTYPG